MAKLHLLDCSAIARSFTPFNGGILSAVVNGEEIETTYMYPILNMLRGQEVNLLEDDIVFCFDRPSKRKLMSDSYKQNRVSMHNSYYEQMRRTEEFLEDLGYNVLYREGYEADDMIAMCVHKYKDYYDNVIIYSNDSDLSGLIDKEGKVYISLLPKKRGFITKDNFEYSIKKGATIPFNSLYLYKATVGDSSDNIKGVNKFGNKSFETMMSYVSQLYNLEEIAEKNYEKEIIEFYFKDDDVSKETALASLDLVKPCLDIIDEISINRISEGYTPNIVATIKMLEVYAMSSIVKSLIRTYL